MGVIEKGLEGLAISELGREDNRENQREVLWRSLDSAGLGSGGEVEWSHHLIDDWGLHSDRKDGQILTDLQGTRLTEVHA